MENQQIKAPEQFLSHFLNRSKYLTKVDSTDRTWLMDAIRYAEIPKNQVEQSISWLESLRNGCQSYVGNSVLQSIITQHKLEGWLALYNFLSMKTDTFAPGGLSTPIISFLYDKFPSFFKDTNHAYLLAQNKQILIERIVKEQSLDCLASDYKLPQHTLESYTSAGTLDQNKAATIINHLIIRCSIQSQQSFLIKRFSKLDLLEISNFQASDERWHTFYLYLVESFLDIRDQLNPAGFKSLLSEIDKETPETSITEKIKQAILKKKLFKNTAQGLKTLVLATLDIFDLKENSDYNYDKLSALVLPKEQGTSQETDDNLWQTLSQTPENGGIFTEQGHRKLIELCVDLIGSKASFTPSEFEILKQNAFETFHKIREHFDATPRREITGIVSILAQNYISSIFIYDQWLTTLISSFDLTNKIEQQEIQVKALVKERLTFEEALKNEDISANDKNFFGEALPQNKETTLMLHEETFILKARQKELLKQKNDMVVAFSKKLVAPSQPSEHPISVIDCLKSDTTSFLNNAKDLNIQLISDSLFNNIKIDRLFDLVKQLITPIAHNIPETAQNENQNLPITYRQLLTELLLPMIAPSRLKRLIAQLTEEHTSIFSDITLQKILDFMNTWSFPDFNEFDQARMRTKLTSFLRLLQTTDFSSSTQNLNFLSQLPSEHWLGMYMIQQSATLFGQIDGENDQIEAFKTLLRDNANETCKQLLELNVGEDPLDLYQNYLRVLARSFKERPNLTESAKKYINSISETEDLTSIAFYNKLSGFYLLLAADKKDTINEAMVWIRLIHEVTSTILECTYGIQYHNDVIKKQINVLLTGILSIFLVIAATILYIYQSWTIFYLLLGSVILSAAIGLVWYHWVENTGYGKNYNLGVVLKQQADYLAGLESVDSISNLVKQCNAWCKDQLVWLSDSLNYITAKQPLIVSATLMGIAYGIAISIPVWALFLHSSLHSFWLVPSATIAVIATCCYYWGAQPIDRKSDKLIELNRATNVSIASLFSSEDHTSSLLKGSTLVI